MSDSISISIILPLYNPNEDWVDEIEKNYSEISKKLHPHQCQLIIVNDGSTKNLESQLKHLSLIIPNNKCISYQKNMGKGHALRTGLGASDADLYILTDIDFPYQNKAVIQLVQNFTDGAHDVYFGQRDQSYYDQIPIVRKAISQVLKILNNLFFKLVINDTQCGFKAMNNQGKEIFLKTCTNGFLYDLEFVKLASKEYELKCQLLPVKLKEGIKLSSIRPLSLFREIKDFIRILFLV